MAAKYTFDLTEQERSELQSLVHKGKCAARKRLHAQIILLADNGQECAKRPNEEIAQILGIDKSTVGRVCRRFVEEGFEAALQRRKHKNHRPRKLDGAQEARLVMLACGQAPDGRARWTMKLLAERLVELDVVGSISKDTVRRTLKKTKSSRGKRSNGASPPRPARPS